MIDASHEYIHHLVNHEKYGTMLEQWRYSEAGPLGVGLGDVHQVQVPSSDVWGSHSSPVAKPLAIDELCVEFYSTFSHVITSSKHNRPYVELVLGGQHHGLTYDGFS
ncbi:unnamed protein product [Linum trigynum]|uniref:Uncharacterized protein n=1 Tax=Linum trigynum TaxID=586398 RepID=A0AAV2ESW0_9ROSI